MRFRGKTLFVTGAAGGIGAATCVRFAREGGGVVAVDRDAGPLAGLVARIEADGGQAIAVEADVTDEAAIVHAIAEGAARFGRIDAAFNNAGVELEATPTALADPAVFARTLDVNVTGVFLCLKHQIAHMLGHGSGAIVNTASVAGLVGVPGLPGYTASKHAVLGLTRTSAVEYAKAGIRVNAVCPGVIRTAMTERAIADAPERAGRLAALHPMGRIGQPEEVAAAALWLCSDEASFVTGQALAIDGGLTAR